MTEQGAVCADCNANAELADASKIRWMSAANIAAAVFLVGGFTCSLELNSVQYSGLVIGPLALICGVGLLYSAVKNVVEPAWLRFGRAGLVLLVAAYNLLGAIPAVIALASS